jgi:hypothetical protein
LSGMSPAAAEPASPTSAPGPELDVVPAVEPVVAEGGGEEGVGAADVDADVAMSVAASPVVELDPDEPQPEATSALATANHNGGSNRAMQVTLGAPV